MVSLLLTNRIPQPTLPSITAWTRGLNNVSVTRVSATMWIYTKRAVRTTSVLQIDIAGAKSIRRRPPLLYLTRIANVPILWYVSVTPAVISLTVLI